MSKRPNYRGLNSKMLEAEETFNRRIKAATENNIPNFSKNEYDLGTTWALQGMSLEDAGDMAKNRSFARGFERGRRLLLIQELDNEETKKATR